MWRCTERKILHLYLLTQYYSQYYLFSCNYILQTMLHVLSIQCQNIWMKCQKYRNKPRWFLSTGQTSRWSQEGKVSGWQISNLSFIHHGIIQTQCTSITSSQGRWSYGISFRSKRKKTNVLKKSRVNMKSIFNLKKVIYNC